MKPSDYIGVLQSTIKVDKEIAHSLEEIIEEYPFFQSARAVYIKYLHDQGSFKYNTHLKITAAHTLDRTVLFDYITSDKFQGIDNIDPIWVEKPITTSLAIPPYVCNVLEELAIVSQITPELLIIKEQVQEEATVAPLHVCNVLEELAIVGQITPELLTIKEQVQEEATAAPLHVCNVLEELAIVGQITPELLTIKEQVQEEATAAPLHVCNVLEELAIVSQITPELLTIKEQVQEEVTAAPLYVCNVLEELAIVSQITPELLTIKEQVQEEATAAPLYVFNTKEELQVIHQITFDILTIKEHYPPVVVEEAKIAHVEEELQLGKPLEFSQSEKHSFQEWLQLTAMQPIDRNVSPPVPIVEPKVQKVEEKQEAPNNQDLIDRFIETNPRMPRANAIEHKEPKKREVAANRPNNNTMLMTETLAKVYLEQKKYDRAIQAYDILILKNPEKKSLFADRIANIKRLKKNNS